MTRTTVAFLPEVGAWGPTLNCVAVAEVLRGRDVRCVFVVDESFAGALAERGFDEVLLRVADPPAEGEGDGWAEYVRVTAPEFRKPTIQQVDTVVKPIWETLVAQGRYAHERLVEIWREVAPDVIVTDNVSAFPSIPTSGRPWVRAVSCNELELQDPALPPIFSGYAEAGGDDWDAFRAEYRRSCGPVFDEFDAFCRDAGAPPLPPLEFAYPSPYLNLFLFPREVAYGRRSRPIGAEWHRLESTVRAPDRTFDVAERLPGDGALIYLSLGSLGSMDVGLMQRLVDVLDATPHRVIVSLGPLAEQLKLGARMYGEEFLPQTAIMPQCDLVITHGGNNTFCETLHFGVPSIALPLFWDQYDNAQRVADCRIGERLPTYAFTPEELTGAIDRLLADGALKARLRGISARIQAEPGQAVAADLIAKLAGTGRA